MKVTLKDISRGVGVSDAAVSLVLSGRARPGQFSAETRSKILAKARELNYLPNINARRLSGKSSQLIGILMDSNAPATVQRIIGHLVKEVSKHGFKSVIAEGHDTVNSYCHSARTLQQYGVDGIISCGHDFSRDIEELRAFFKEFPHTVFAGLPEVPMHSYTYVQHDAGIIAAVEHLKLRGRSRIHLCLPAPVEYASIQQRILGWRQVMDEPDSNLHIFSPVNSIRTQIVQILDEILLPNHADAVILSNDILAHALLSECVRRGIRVPDDLAVIGHDNDPFAAESYPPLTTIDENVDMLAANAVALMVRSLQQPEFAPAMTEAIPVVPSLIVREST